MVTLRYSVSVYILITCPNLSSKYNANFQNILAKLYHYRYYMTNTKYNINQHKENMAELWSHS